MSLDKLQNEWCGNHVEWRIVTNRYRRENSSVSLFVCRIVDRGDGLAISEFLQVDGTVEGTTRNGWFATLAQIGAALIRHDVLLAHAVCGANQPNHQRYLDRFRKPQEPSNGGSVFQAGTAWTDFI